MSPAVVTIVLCTIVVVAILQLRIEAVKQRVAALSRLEEKVDLLLKNANIKYDPAANLPADVVDAVRRGAKIEAIKRYRQATGAGLKDAKDFIERLQGQFGTF